MKYLKIIFITFHFSIYSMNTMEQDVLFDELFSVHNHKFLIDPQASSYFSLYSNFNVQSVLSENPEILLEGNVRSMLNYSEFASLYERFPSSLALQEESAKIIREESGRNSLFLIDECRGSLCVLQRAENPLPRKLFEEKIAQELKARSNEQRALNYVSLGAGKLFSDLRALNLAFDSPIQELNFFAIDSAYQRYLDYLQKKFEPSTISHIVYLQATAVRFYQFAQLFAKFHKGKTLNLLIYSSLTDYVKNVELDSSLKADLFVGTDLDAQGIKAFTEAPLTTILRPSGVQLQLEKKFRSKRPSLCSLIKLWPCGMVPTSNNEIVLEKQNKDNRCKTIVSLACSSIINRKYSILKISYLTTMLDVIDKESKQIAEL